MKVIIFKSTKKNVNNVLSKAWLAKRRFELKKKITNHNHNNSNNNNHHHHNTKHCFVNK